MVLWILLIVFGFLIRIVKLYEVISVNLCGRARAWISIRAWHLLRITFSWCCLGNSPKSLKCTLLYRPLLTIFLVAELGLDGGSLFLLEVSYSVVHSPIKPNNEQVGWLAIGFVWGPIRLIRLLRIQDSI